MTQINPIAVSVAQAAQALQISDRTVFALLDNGQLTSVKIGSSRRIPMSELTRLAREGAALPTVAERQSKSRQVAA